MPKDSIQERIQGYLTAIYPGSPPHEIWPQLEEKIAGWERMLSASNDGADQDILANLNTLLITYADQFQSPGQSHLTTLGKFLKDELGEYFSAIHLLPFFPFSSDDGFSIIDFKKISPGLGSWSDLNDLRESCILMFDAVINHISSQSAWFQGFLAGEQPYRDYFLVVDPETDLSAVTRPRAHPLLTEVQTTAGPVHVWTTFSDDQIDLNYKNPTVLLDILDVLFFYVHQGAQLLRLDAIAYLWKEIGTSSIHLPQTHLIIKLIRAVFDLVAPEVILITETNVPHQENISYFGAKLDHSPVGYPRGDEAQIVYQFPLAPLVLHTIQKGDAKVLTRWASALEVPFQTAIFLNFIASHDGIGIRPAEGLLSEIEIQSLVDQTLEHGGQVSYRTQPDGSQSVYELNITLYDMLNPPDSPSLDLAVQRYLASQAIMLSLAGVPGIYVHSLFGAPNSQTELEKTGRARSINREKYQLQQLQQELEDANSRSARVYRGYLNLLKVRQDQHAFHPLASQQVLELDPKIFALIRASQDGMEHILCLINISDSQAEIYIDEAILESPPWTDLISGREYQPGNLILSPYQVLWLK